MSAMKNIKLTTITILILVLAFSYCGKDETVEAPPEPPPAPAPVPCPVKSEGVGPFKVGRTVKKLKEIIEKREKLSISSEEGGNLEVAKEGSLRTAVVTLGEGAYQQVYDFLDSRITNPRIGFDLTICDPPDAVCSLNPFPTDVTGDVFAGERVISTSLEGDPDGFTPKKIKIFLWVKN